jgi:phosphate transport system protein
MSEETPMPADDDRSAAPLATPGQPAGQAAGQTSRPTLDRDEQEIKDSVLRMGSLVEAQILASIDTLVDHDVTGAERVIAGDARINDAQREVTTLIARTIATQQPVARDLRFLLALYHVAFELERIGDHAASVAKIVIRLSAEPPVKPYIDLPEMGRLGAELVRGILRALVTIDDALAREVAARDDEIDHLYHRIFGEIVDLMRRDPANVERGTRILLAAHYLERIGDRVTNIAEDVVYLASGEVEDLNP